VGLRSQRLTACRPLSRPPWGPFALSVPPAWIRENRSTPEASRGARAGLKGTTKGTPEELLIAWLKARFARLCGRLIERGKLGTVYSWHDLRHSFAERNAARGLVWLRERLGHSSVAVTERYLRNVLNADTERM